MILSIFKTIIFAMVPIGEYQTAIPTAIFHWGLSPLVAWGASLLGSLLILPVVLLLFLRARSVVENIWPSKVQVFDALLERARRKLGDKYEAGGAIALFFFLVIPFPLTGIWTASLAAVALDIPWRYAFWGIFSGAAVGSGLVALGSVGGLWLLG